MHIILVRSPHVGGLCIAGLQTNPQRLIVPEGAISPDI